MGSTATFPSYPVLQKLNNLDKSSSEFHVRLNDVLYAEEYIQCVANIQGDDLTWLVDFLDNVLGGLTPSSATFQKCIRELESLCGSRATLPTSCTPPPGLTIDPEPMIRQGHDDVYRGMLDGSEIYVKRLPLRYWEDPEKAAQTLCREAVLWRHLNHPKIVPLFGVSIAPRQLISFWTPGNNLLDGIKNLNPDRLGLLSDIADGLCYLHSRDVIHGDLKGYNILVDDSGHARITDFGLPTITQDSESPQNTGLYTARWAAPEVLRDGICSKEADIFSFAMVMIEVFTGAVPFSEKRPPEAMYHILNGGRPPRPTHPACTVELWALMQSCWNQDPRLRPTVSEVLNVLRGFNYPAWKLLITATLPTHEIISLITTIFSNSDQSRAIRNLSGDDAQAFVDRLEGVLDGLAPQIHRKCLRYLYDICGNQALLPTSLEIPLRYNPAEDPVSRSGFADVRKGRYRGREVAARVSRIWSGDDAGKIKSRFCREVVAWRALRHPNILPLLGVTVAENQLVTASEWMPNGNIMRFTKAHTNVDRLRLLRGVTRGLIYMHDQRIIHGDLRGVNIMIDGDGHARLTGLNLVTITSDRSTVSSLSTAGGAIAWMSPELLHPERFGSKKPHPTTESDCYALGMVIYEVLSGQAPFSGRPGPEVVFLVLQGNRPKKLQGSEAELFTDEIWEMLELCWKYQPGDRLIARDVLIGLGGSLSPSDLPSDAYGDPETGVNGQPNDTENRPGPPPAGIEEERGVPQRVINPGAGWVRVLRRGFKKFLATLDSCRRFPYS